MPDATSIDIYMETFYLIFTIPWGRNYYYSCLQKMRLREVKSPAPGCSAIKGQRRLSHSVNKTWGPWSTNCPIFSPVWFTSHILASSLYLNYHHNDQKLSNVTGDPSPFPGLSTRPPDSPVSSLRDPVLCQNFHPFSSELCKLCGPCICLLALSGLTL